MHEVHSDNFEIRRVSQFRWQTTLPIVACAAVLCVLCWPRPMSLAERWSNSSARTEEVLIDKFGPPQPVGMELVEKLKELKLKGMAANARWMQWTEPGNAERFFIAIVKDGKAMQRLDVQIHDDGREMEIKFFLLEDSW